MNFEFCLPLPAVNASYDPLVVNAAFTAMGL